MSNTQNQAPLKLSGRWQYQLRSIVSFFGSLLYITIRRLVRGALFPNWSWAIEASLHFMKKHSSTAFDMQDIADGREYEDAFLFGSPAVSQVNITPIQSPIKGDWYQPKSGAQDITILYLHGGGYVYYSKAHENLIALVALAAEARAFVPDYRLAPEHAYPAQLEDALAAYHWLLETGIAPERIAVIGDSAGGNLTLALLLALRKEHAPLPALAVGICPWTDLSNSGDSMTTNDPYDLIDKRMADQWAKWFTRNANVNDPMISPIHADLRGLPPIYLQAGSAEILHDMIRAFADQAEKQGAQVKLDVWQNMPHDFQALGDLIPESKEALMRIGEFVRQHVKLN